MFLIQPEVLVAGKLLLLNINKLQMNIVFSMLVFAIGTFYPTQVPVLTNTLNFVLMFLITISLLYFK